MLPPFPRSVLQLRRLGPIALRLLSQNCLIGMIAVSVAVGLLGATSHAGQGVCRAVTFAGDRFIVCEYDTRSVDITIHWRSTSGKPYASVTALRSAFEANGRLLLLAMNGGMYHEDLSPVGYYVERRQKLNEANTRPGPGNFHMLPNGIFFIEDDRAGVMETRAFLRRNQRPDFATQSGPMLVINGDIHPRFKSSSEHRKQRNGVGVSGDGRTVYFALSDGVVTFYNFAKLFQEQLKARNALFLDGGTAPQMITPEFSRLSFAPAGPIIAVTARDD